MVNREVTMQCIPCKDNMWAWLKMQTTFSNTNDSYPYRWGLDVSNTLAFAFLLLYVHLLKVQLLGVHHKAGRW